MRRRSACREAFAVLVVDPDGGSRCAAWLLSTGTLGADRGRGSVPSEVVMTIGRT